MTRRYYTTADVETVAERVHDIICDHHCTPRPQDRSEARVILDAVARRMVCNAAADALEGALHLVDDDDSAETLARLADQWRIEATS